MVWLRAFGLSLLIATTCGLENTRAERALHLRMAAATRRERGRKFDFGSLDGRGRLCS